MAVEHLQGSRERRVLAGRYQLRGVLWLAAILALVLGLLGFSL